MSTTRARTVVPTEVVPAVATDKPTDTSIAVVPEQVRAAKPRYVRSPAQDAARQILNDFADFASSSYSLVPVVAAEITESPELATRENSEPWSGVSILPIRNNIMNALGTNSVSTFLEITTDEQVLGAINAMKADVMSMKFAIDRDVDRSSRNETRSETVAQQIIARVFENIDEYQLRSDILNAKVWGIQPIEIIWKVYGANWLPCRATAKPAWWFAYTPDNKFVKVKLWSTQSFDVMPEQYRFLIPSHNADYFNPYGMPLIASCYWPVKRKRAVELFNIVALEQFGLPLVDYAYDPNMHGDADNVDGEVTKIAEMGHGRYVAHPIGETLTYTTMPSGSFDGFAQYIERQDAAISKALLSHGSAMDSTPGKLGNDNTGDRIALARKLADKRLVEDEMNRLIRWIYDINVADKSIPIPVYELYDEDDIDENLSLRDWRLSLTGAEFTVQYYRRTYGFQEGDVTIKPKVIPPQFSSHIHPVKDTSKGQLAVDKLIVADPTTRAKQMADMIQPILTKLDGTEGYGEAIKSLASLYGDMPDDELRDEIERALLFTTLRGEMEVEEEVTSIIN